MKEKKLSSLDSAKLYRHCVQWNGCLIDVPLNELEKDEAEYLHVWALYIIGIMRLSSCSMYKKRVISCQIAISTRNFR